MNVFDFITQDELDELPDDPRFAFLEFANHAQRRLSKKTQELGGTEEGWEELQEARHGFMNVLIAAGKRFEIEPFVEMEVPTRDSFQGADYQQFKTDLDHYTTQLVLDNSIRGRRETVLLTDKSKDRIRSHLVALRDCVSDSSLPDSKKSALKKRLDEFQADLDRKSRLNLLAVTRVTIEILAIPGALWASGDVATKLITNVMQEVGEAKVAEDDERKMPSAPPKALTPPRKPIPGPADLDDEIPF